MKPVEARGSWYRRPPGGERGRYRLSISSVCQGPALYAVQPSRRWSLRS